MARKMFEAAGATAIGPYSHAVDMDGVIYLSGQTPVMPGGALAEGISNQTQQCFKNLFAVLEAAGLIPDDVQKVNVYLTDMKNFPEMNAVYEKQFSKPYPARTTVAVAALPLGASVEIEMIAKRK
ncbi:MAG: Rid family detoxifying hydrolase [Eubacteriales bacterium]|nr:Rid family detoxifying hydrolase [Eubacteriales bacterium]